jgi:membrane protein implicated in regulation of membrane protease activity
LPINVSTILAFIGWFGGVALLAHQGAGWPALISLIVGIGGGLIGAAIIGWFLLKVVAPNDRALDPRDYELPGTIARVTSSIRTGGTGEVVYEQGGVRQVAAAKSADGAAIGRGDEVVVLRVEKGVALVERSATFFGNDLIEPDEAAIHPLSSGGRR